MAYKNKKKRMGKNKMQRPYENPHAMLKEANNESGIPDKVIMKKYPKLDYMMQGYGDSYYDMDMNFDKNIKVGSKQLGRKRY